MGEVVYSGQMNRQIEFFENANAKNDSGEAIRTPVSLGKKFVKRVDGNGTEEIEGRALGVAMCTYQLRYDPAIATKMSQLYVVDFDGEWEVTGPYRLLDSRTRYMEIKCVKRGES